jgi:uncharacterized protein (TIGR02271 family)
VTILVTRPPFFRTSPDRQANSTQVQFLQKDGTGIATSSAPVQECPDEEANRAGPQVGRPEPETGGIHMSINDRDREIPLNQDRNLRDDQAERDARLTLSEEELAVGKRRMEAGEVDIHKRVETEHVSRPVTTTREEAVIERRPITDASMAAGARIEGDEIHVPLMEEEAVVEKRVVPKEELVVKKREVQETETVEADLRRERVDVDREGDARIRDERNDRL